MKIFKDKTHSLLPRPVMIQGRQNLALGVMLFFDLTSPDALLDEQELWKTVPQVLGPNPILDQGMPKLNGEYLVVGECCAPRNTRTRSSEVMVTVGNRSKRLYVFGERKWSLSGGISEPQEFERMPVSWENAYGGPGFERNPSGKGTYSELIEGLPHAHLPNVEDPQHIIGLPSDQPEPVSFAPWDMTWPQRSKNTGTYDKRWKTERWPGLPEDFDYSFFNAAPLDQRLNGFFKGNELIEIKNMHPDYQHLASSLPGLRMRCFVTLLQGYSRFIDKKTCKEVFQEVALHPETLWLFPSILRGVLIYRGAVPVADEDYGDVLRIFLAHESLTKPPESLEHYLEAQKKALDRSVPVDMAPFDAARAKASEAVLRMKNIRKDMERIKNSALGKSPVMPRSAAERGAIFKQDIAARLQTLDRLEAIAGGMKQRFGHLASIDMKPFAALRAKVQGLGGKVDAAVGKLEALHEKGAAKKAQLLENNKNFLREQLTPEQLAKTGLDPDKLLPDRATPPWHNMGFPFVVNCRRTLEQHAGISDTLHRMGLNRRTVRTHWLGFNPEARSDAPHSWGLNKEPADAMVHLPAGLVMPRFHDAILSRITIRPPMENNDYTQGDADSVVSGSDATPLFLRAAEQEGPVLVTTDELQALLLEQEIGDACHVLVLASPDASPSPDAALALQHAPRVLVIRPQGTTDQDAAWKPWATSLKKAHPLALPKGQTVFDSRAAGTDIRQWIMDALPRDFAQTHALFPDLPEDGSSGGSMNLRLPFPALDIGGFATGLMQEIRGAHQPAIDAARANKGRMIESLRTQFAGQGLDPERSLADAAKQPRTSYTQMGDEMAQQMLGKRDEYNAAGYLTADQSQKITEQAAKIRHISEISQSRKERQTARFAALSQKAQSLKAQALSRKLPGPAGVSMEKAGLSPDAMAPLTREQVISRYKAGLDFKHKNLSGVDISGLDLTGIDLRQAIMNKAKCRETNFTQARMQGVVSSDADFGKADFARAHLEGCMLRKANMAEANLAEANLKRSVIAESDLSKVNCGEAAMRMVQLNKCKLNQASFAHAKCSLSMITGCECLNASFANASLRKVVFRDCLLDQTSFAGATCDTTALQNSRGKNINFQGANMDRSRILSGSSFPGANLQNTTLRNACFREADLSDATFRHAVLDTAMLEGCILHRADFERISAKKARLTKCDMEYANLRAVNLAMGSLRMSRLVRADFTGANLFGVDFYKTTVGKTNFHLANMERTLLQDNMDLLK